uniref:Uncharacterized protein n=1 Tax=Arundo donax TaxID=35708 RepID=A0A0A8YW14_ARUDO
MGDAIMRCYILPLCIPVSWTGLCSV